MPGAVPEQWLAPERFPALAAGEAHVWRIPVEAPAAVLDRYARMLSAEERARGERYRFAELRQRFTLRRGAMRCILATYLGAAPQSLAYEDAGRGRPALAGRWAGALFFNLSDSGALALLAVCLDRRVGVDIELIRPAIAALEIAERFFSKAERDALAAVPAGEAIPAFYRCWTRKEAYLKGTGEGIAEGLARCSVSIKDGAEAGLLHVDGDPDAPRRWLLRSLPIDSGYEAALAMEQRNATVRFWCWQHGKDPIEYR